MKSILTSSICGASLVIVMAMSGCRGEDPRAASNPPPQAPAVEPPAPDPASRRPEEEVIRMPSPTPPRSTAVNPAGDAPAAAAPVETPAIDYSAGDDPRTATFGGLIAPKPPTWIWHPPQRQFSIAEYAVPGRDGHDQARIDVFQAGGSIQMNIDRWKTQFRGPDGGPVEPIVQELTSADGLEITLVEFAGEYKGMGAVSYTPNQLFLCAIVQAPSGQLFIRLVGPAGTVEPNREAFMGMIEGLRRVEPAK